jgi:hypothetical protein
MSAIEVEIVTSRPTRRTQGGRRQEESTAAVSRSARHSRKDSYLTQISARSMTVRHPPHSHSSPVSSPRSFNTNTNLAIDLVPETCSIHHSHCLSIFVRWLRSPLSCISCPVDRPTVTRSDLFHRNPGTTNRLTKAAFLSLYVCVRRSANWFLGGCPPRLGQGRRRGTTAGFAPRGNSLRPLRRAIPAATLTHQPGAPATPCSSPLLFRLLL